MVMEASAQLALMTKASKVFGNENTFLSFPVMPQQFTKEELSFMSTFNVKNLKTFSLLVNQIPDGEAWLPTEERYLWNICTDVLQGIDTEVAWSSRTPEQENQYQNACQFLNKVNPNGSIEDTDAVKIYKQFRDQWFALQEKYSAAKNSGELTADPELKKQWKEVEEPKLRQNISDLEARWIREGFRYEVEQAQEVKARLGAKSPSTTWNQWKTQFMAAIDTLTDVDNVSYYPSSFSPINAIEEGSWQRFSIGKDEIKALINQAPAELRSRLSVDSNTAEITSITFEFSSATILRTWCDSEMFKARFWRFTDNAKKLSDGSTPPAGLCPAYVTAVVFARNISVTKATSSPNQTGSSQNQSSSESQEKLHFPSAVQAVKLQPKIKLIPKESLVSKPLPSESLRVNPAVLNRVVQPNLANSVQASQLNYLSTAPVNNYQALNVARVSPEVQRISPDVLQQISPKVQGRAIARPSNASEISTAFQRLKDASIVRPTLPTSEDQPTPSSTSQPSVTPKDQIYILAFICKLLPSSPNPDPALQW